MNAPFTDMRVSLSEGTRRLPVYLLLDCSSSMAGTPVQAVQEGVERFVRDTQADEFASETVHVGIITFATDAELRDGGLVPIDACTPPKLTANGRTSLGKALTVLEQSIERDIKPSVEGGEVGDWKPLVFILTDGQPNDEWQGPRQQLLARQERKVVDIVCVGCGPNVDDGLLKEIGLGKKFYMRDIDADSFGEFFKWVTQSVQRVSQEAGAQGDDFAANKGDEPDSRPLADTPDHVQFIP
jgi:uncharacterized protein YegL